jgi:hypothetical protein
MLLVLLRAGAQVPKKPIEIDAKAGFHVLEATQHLNEIICGDLGVLDGFHQNSGVMTSETLPAERTAARRL